MSKVECNNVWKVYKGDVVAVKNLSFTCKDKEFLAILGPSGGGKSSTLRMLAGLEEISKGEILFDGKVVNNLNPSERNIALAFESYALYNRLTVYENIAFPLMAKGMNKKDAGREVNFVAKALNLIPVLKRRPGELAGGHQQRISLARALVRRPNVTLLDEPLSHMDQRIRAEIRARIRRIHEDFGNTTIYVTHDQAEAISLCDRLLILNQAEIQQIGTVKEIWNKPVNKFVAYFIGEPGMNFIQGKIEDTGNVSIQTKEGKKIFKFNGEIDSKYIGHEITIGVRPQQIIIVSTRGEESIPGLVKIIEFLGDKEILTVELNDVNKTQAKVVIQSREKKIFKREDACYLKFPQEFIHLFNSEDRSIVCRK